MEKDGILGGNPSADFNWSSNTISPPAAQVMEMNLDSAGNSSFLNLNNWEQSPAHDANFESALSSLVSSPTTTTSAAAAACNNPSPDSIVIRELIGRLGSICNNNSSSNNYQSTNSSCYATPLSSPPKLNISIPQFPPPTPMGVDYVTDSGFAERAARFSCFGAARNYAQFGELSSGQSLKENDMTRMMMMMAKPDWDLGLNVNNCVKSSNARDDSPPSDRIMTPSSESNVGRKRKANLSSSSSSSKGSRGGRNDARHNPRKASEEDEKSKSKRCKSPSGKGDDKDAVKVEQKNEKDKESNTEFPKQDYIHVRARRGQATDSHSLAERVRREKISERMKFLQDLVPGCNKVTGKAVMLDEIINYVQALQGQVEFLSMKLATVNPQMDQPRGHPLEARSSCGFSYANQAQGQGPPLQSLMASNALETRLDPSYLGVHLDGFTDATSTHQPGAFWEDDLHSVVQMGFVQNLQGAPGGPTRHMKLEP